MSLAKGMAISVVCGGIGAAAWAGLTYATGWQLGLVAIVVGGAAGFGMAQGNEGRGGPQAGLIAAIVALVSILGGNFAAAQVLVREHIDDAALTSEDGVNMLAQEIYDDMAAAGETFEDDEWDEEGQWPVVVRYKAETRWEAMSEPSRAEFLSSREAEYKQEMEGAAPLMGLIAFLFMTLHWKSLIIIGLGVSTAYKIGATDMKAQAAARGAVAEEAGPAASPAAAPRQAAAGARASSRSAPPSAPADEESGTSGYRLPAMRDPEADNLPSIEEIMRKHAAAQGGGEAEGDARQAA